VVVLAGWVGTDSFFLQPFHGGSSLDKAMRKLTLTLAILLLIGGNVFAENYQGPLLDPLSGRDVTVRAESSSEARPTVMEMFPVAVVTGSPLK
jgi:hypothetical protein